MMTVDDLRAGLSSQSRAMIDALRAIVASSCPGLVESVKWNAPNFAIDGHDRITLGLERKGGVRLVLHRGAQVRGAADFRFDDPDRLARWPSPDRGVLFFPDLASIEAQREALLKLCRRWIDETM